MVIFCWGVLGWYWVVCLWLWVVFGVGGLIGGGFGGSLGCLSSMCFDECYCFGL